MVDISDIVIPVLTGAVPRASLLQTPAVSLNPTLSSFAVLIFLFLTLIGNCTAIASSPWVILVAVLVSNLAARLASPRVKLSVKNAPKSHNFSKSTHPYCLPS